MHSLATDVDGALRKRLATTDTLGVMGGCFRGGISRVDTVVQFMVTSCLCTATAVVQHSLAKEGKRPL